jgi:hypothetical protein|tara:strand:+ start:3722 stop:3883 length:162 start_codon:yes stop_codon:yes gene_type:complete
MTDDSLYITIDKLKEQVDELKAENIELQHTVASHEFLDTGIPQMFDRQTGEGK